MAGASGMRAQRSGRKSGGDEPLIDRELADLPPEARWREWMMRVEAVIFASAEPVTRDVLARVVGESCSIDLLIDDLREELKGRPYEIVPVAGGFHHRTRGGYGAAVRAASVTTRPMPASLSDFEAGVLMAIGYFQPVTRAELSRIFGREVSRDMIGSLRSAGFIGSGPRSPTPGAPYTYVTTRHFLSAFGFSTLRDLPDIEALEDAGLLSRHALAASADAADTGEGGEDGSAADAGE
jgi:segregation and condensation protein B